MKRLAKCVIRFVAFNGIPGPIHQEVPVGAYLKAYDPDAHDGRGDAAWSVKPEDALEFDTFTEAMNFWRQISTVKPFREDGQPNRPLTACSIEVTKLS